MRNHDSLFSWFPVLTAVGLGMVFVIAGLDVLIVFPLHHHHCHLLLHQVACGSGAAAGCERSWLSSCQQAVHIPHLKRTFTQPLFCFPHIAAPCLHSLMQEGCLLTCTLLSPEACKMYLHARVMLCAYLVELLFCRVKLRETFLQLARLPTPNCLHFHLHLCALQSR